MCIRATAQDLRGPQEVLNTEMPAGSLPEAREVGYGLLREMAAHLKAQVADVQFRLEGM